MKSPLVVKFAIVALMAGSLLLGCSDKNTYYKEFPNQIPYKLGICSLENGDRISIQEVRGVHSTLMPGERFFVRGTYTLASKDEARLALSVTATRGQLLTDRRNYVFVKKGSGSYELSAIMPDAGWPHVDFYSSIDGMAFGGAYFGEGEFLLKNPPSDMEMEALQTIPYDLGYRSLENGDEIVIRELRGVSGSLAPGERFFVRGTYALASTDEARLFLSVLATSGQTPERKNNWDNLVIKKGHGMFTLSTVMPEAGFPRLRYLSSDGKEFGEVFFGKGESLLTMSAEEYQRKMEAQFADPSKHGASSQITAKKISYELGSRSLENGDEIVIQEVRGGDGSFVPGERFFVSGTYKLASRDEAILRLSVENTLGQAPQPDGRNNLIVQKGEGSFDFSIIMPDAGYPRMSLISLDRRKAFGSVYFGKGETLSHTP